MWQIWVWDEKWGLSHVLFEEKDLEFYLRSFPDAIYFYRMVM